jgi:hypothetical protein
METGTPRSNSLGDLLGRVGSRNRFDSARKAQRKGHSKFGEMSIG